MCQADPAWEASWTEWVGESCQVEWASDECWANQRGEADHDALEENLNQARQAGVARKADRVGLARPVRIEGSPRLDWWADVVC